MQSHLNERQLAARWNISARTLQHWRRHQKGPVAIRLGSRIVYPLVNVEEYERAHQLGGTGGKTK